MLDLQVLLQIGWTSVATSSYSVLFAIAFALTLKVARLWNFAQAGIMGAAFYAMYVAMLRWQWPHAAGFAFSLAIAIAASIGIEVWGFRVFRRRRSSPLIVFIFAIVFADADLTLVDLERERVVKWEELQSYADYSLYDGWTLKGWPVKTIVRGTTVMDNGKIVGAQGHGKYVWRRLGKPPVLGKLN